MSRSEFSEEDVRIRPVRANPRPRSKERPKHRDAEAGFVTAVDRGRLTVVVGERIVTAVRAREMGRRTVVVGDRVAVVGDTSGSSGTLARIVRVEPRETALLRTADDVDPVERVVVANAQTLGIVASVTDPEPRGGFIDRCLVAAYDAGIEPLLIVTKTDLSEAKGLRDGYRALGVPLVEVARGRSLIDLQRQLHDRISVLIGQSGVGKSTLVNQLAPGADRMTGSVNEVTGRGRHTSTSVVALPLPDGGWVIDTPGLRSFGLGHVDPSRVIAAFGDLSLGVRDCPRGCDHLPPHCALDEWVDGGRAGPDGRARLESIRRVLASRASSTGSEGR